jgi:serine protease Do
MKLTHRIWMVCTGIVIACPIIAQQPAWAKSIIEIGQLAKSVTVLIQGPDTGSGVLIRQSGSTYTVLTARHVLDATGSYEVVTTTGQRYPINVQSVRKLPGLDLALFQFASPDKLPVATVGNSNTLQEGTTVYVTGFPGQGSTINALAYNFTSGQLTARSSRPQEGGYALVYTNKTLPGMSGGPVFDQEAQLVGIHGAADGQSQTLEKLNSRVFVKTGFNLGIPINTFLAAAEPNSLQDKTIALASQSNLSEGSQSTQIQLQSSPRQSSPKNSFPTNTATPVKKTTKISANFGGAGSGDYFLSALNQYIRGNLSAATVDCNKALKLNPKFAAAYSLRGNLRYIAQDYSGALSDFSQAVQLDNRLAAAYLGRGLSQSAMSNPEAALADYTQAIQLSPDTLAYYNRGVINLNLGNQAAAQQDLQKSADLALAEGNQPDYDRAKEALNIAGRNCNQSIRTICDR